MAERGLGARSDLRKVGWEVSEFPILCETCLGDIPYVRMTKSDWDKECRICTRPFIVFRWKPGSKARFKKTEICQTCAKMKNVCQTCLFDLQYGLPVEVRDKFLKNKVEVPRDAVNRDFWAHQMTKILDKVDLPYEKEGSYPVLEKLSRKEPYYKRNLSHICSFFVKGNCARGDQCPYRHEVPEINELSEQNIKDRFYGVNDPVAKKILRGFSDLKPPPPPLDKNVTTIFIGGITDDSLREKDLSNLFQPYGEVKKVKILLKNYCAFVTFNDRSQAENAMNNLFNKFTIKGEKYKLQWGKSSKTNFDDEEAENKNNMKDISYKTECPINDPLLEENVLTKVDKVGSNKGALYNFNLNTYDTGKKPYYPSMDPNLMV